MWDECIKHIMECIEERDKDLPSCEKLDITEDDIDFILWLYHEFKKQQKINQKNHSINAKDLKLNVTIVDKELN